MPAPSNYDDSGLVINVDPTTMFSYATVDMVSEADAIGDAIVRVEKIWQGLALGWAGATADEAQDFSDRWNSAMTAMFGSTGDPGSGALEKISTAVGVAALNYAVTEDGVTQMFTKLTGAVNNPSGSVGPPVRGGDPSQDQVPITEVTPSW